MHGVPVVVCMVFLVSRWLCAWCCEREGTHTQAPGKPPGQPPPQKAAPEGASSKELPAKQVPWKGGPIPITPSKTAAK